MPCQISFSLSFLLKAYGPTPSEIVSCQSVLLVSNGHNKFETAMLPGIISLQKITKCKMKTSTEHS